MRTAPLWGLHSRNKLLHDGRTTDRGAAILAHAGQGAAASAAYAALSTSSQSDLLAGVLEYALSAQEAQLHTLAAGELTCAARRSVKQGRLHGRDPRALLHVHGTEAPSVVPYRPPDIALLCFLPHEA